MFSAQLTVCFHDLVRHFKTEPTETVALCFGYQKNPNQLILCQLARWRGYESRVYCLQQRLYTSVLHATTPIYQFIVYNNDDITVYCIQQRLYTSVLHTTTIIYQYEPVWTSMNHTPTLITKALFQQLKITFCAKICTWWPAAIRL
jgi:hypothetical protein